MPLPTDYLRGFTHDIKNSLGVVQTCLDPSLGVDFAAVARRHIEKALTLVSQFESSISDERQVAAPISGEALHALLDEFPALYPQARVRFDCPKTGWSIHSSLELLRRILDNCVSNAVNAGHAEWVLLGCCYEDDVVQITVKDRGCGMSDAQVKRIGLGFSTTGGGDGTKILVDLLARAGGVVRWESIKDVGTCVTLTFRRA